MLLPVGAVLAGLVLLIWSADRFVVGASVTARGLGVSPLLIGLTIVGFGTSAPEILVSAVASFQGSAALAVGNAIGSNITNIGLVLGAAALIAPMTVRSGIVRRELPALILTMLFVLSLLLDGGLSAGDGVALAAALALMMFWIIGIGLRERRDLLSEEYDRGIGAGMSLGRGLSWVIAGLALLLVSSRLLVWGAVNIAQAIGVSELVIGLTVVAIGTSLPELAASVMSAVRKEYDIAIGNVIGSNMFNLLAVMGMPALIAPGILPTGVLSRDYPVMIAMTAALIGMAYGYRGRKGRINRAEGGALVGIYCVYLVALYRGGLSA